MSARQGKVIITAAITGGIHVPAQSPYLPVTPEQIIDECVKAHAAGAAVCHIHVREPETGLRGSGIGLSIVQEYVAAHGGRIALMPSAAGACFRIELPYASVS